MPWNKLGAWVVSLVLFGTVHGQRVTVQSQMKKLDGAEATGYGVVLEGTAEEVSAAWAKYLKDLGKTRQVPGRTTVADPALGGTVYEGSVLYALTDGDKENTSVWLGLIEDEWKKVNDLSLVTRELEDLTYRFGVKYYRDKIQVRIDEAVRALNAVERQQQRLENQNRDLNNKLAGNEQEKIRLENSLEANQLEHAVLLVKIEENKKSQDSVAQAGEQIRKVIELHKEQQRKVN